jgi:hypothetical protein
MIVPTATAFFPNQTKAPLGFQNFPTLSGVVVFQKLSLPQKHHTLRIVNAGAQRISFQSSKVYR